MATDEWGLPVAAEVDEWGLPVEAQAKKQAPAKTVTEDIARSAGPEALRGVVGAVATPGSLSNLFSSAGEWALRKVLPADSQPIQALEALKKIDTDAQGKSIGEKQAFFPDYNTAMDKVEAKTGPLPVPEGTAAKVVGNTLKLAPNLAMGGYSIPGLVTRSIAGGAAGEAGRQGGEALKPSLPESLQPIAEPAGEMIGMIAGTGVPGVTARAVAPKPTAEQASIIKYLRHNAPEVLESATAGQVTNRPWLMAAENRLGKFANGAQADKQEQVFTKTVNNFASDTGGQIGKIYDNGKIKPQPWQDAVDTINDARNNIQNIQGMDQSILGRMNKMVDRITTAGTGKKPSIDGKQYQVFRDELQGAIDSAPNTTVKKAYTDMKTALDAAFDLSQPDGGAKLATLRADKVAFEDIANRKPTLSGSITPQEVLSAAAARQGNKAVNQGKSAAAELAQNSSRVMQDLPKANFEVPPWMDLGQSLVSALANKLAFGGHNPMEAAVLGHLLSQSTANAVRGVNSRLFGNNAAQQFIKQNAENPQSILFADPNRKALTAARILANPADYPLLEDQTK